MKRWASAMLVSLKDGEKMQLKEGERLVFDSFDGATSMMWFVLIREWDE